MKIIWEQTKSQQVNIHFCQRGVQNERAASGRANLNRLACHYCFLGNIICAAVSIDTVCVNYREYCSQLLELNNRQRQKKMGFMRWDKYISYYQRNLSFLSDLLVLLANILREMFLSFLCTSLRVQQWYLIIFVLFCRARLSTLIFNVSHIKLDRLAF